MLDLLEPELQVFVRCLVWVPGFELESSGRTGLILNHRAISLALCHFYFYFFVISQNEQNFSTFIYIGMSVLSACVSVPSIGLMSAEVKKWLWIPWN